MKVINKLNEYFLGEPDEVYWTDMLYFWGQYFIYGGILIMTLLIVY